MQKGLEPVPELPLLNLTFGIRKYERGSREPRKASTVSSHEDLKKKKLDAQEPQQAEKGLWYKLGSGHRNKEDLAALTRETEAKKKKQATRFVHQKKKGIRDVTTLTCSLPRQPTNLSVRGQRSQYESVTYSTKSR